MRKLKSLLAAVAMLAAAPAAAQLIEAPTGPWSPAGIDASFPDTIGDFERVSINRYGSAEDHAIGYNAWNADDSVANAITVYLLAPRGECATEMDSSMAALEKANAGAVKLSVGTVPSPTGKRGAALHARYRLPNGYGATKVPVISDIYLYCPANSRYWIKARSTWPEAQPNREGGTDTVLRAVRWPAETR